MLGQTLLHVDAFRARFLYRLLLKRLTASRENRPSGLRARGAAIALHVSEKRKVWMTARTHVSGKRFGAQASCRISRLPRRAASHAPPLQRHTSVRVRRTTCQSLAANHLNADKVADRISFAQFSVMVCVLASWAKNVMLSVIMPCAGTGIAAGRLQCTVLLPLLPLTCGPVSQHNTGKAEQVFAGTLLAMARRPQECGARKSFSFSIALLWLLNKALLRSSLVDTVRLHQLLQNCYVPLMSSILSQNVL